MPGKVTGGNELVTYLRNMATRVPDTARKVMHRGADRIVREARLNTPVDQHNLEDSIHKEVTYSFRGRLQIDIIVGGFVRGVNVSMYAAEVHEAYETSVAPGGPGKGTLAKMAANPGRLIGSKFLERAVAEEEPKLRAAIIAAVNAEIVR